MENGQAPHRAGGEPVQQDRPSGEPLVAGVSTMSDRGLERRHLPPRPDEGVLREVFEYGFTRLDPVGGTGIDPPSVAVYETLLRKGPGGVALPGLASSWEESSDGLSCRVSFREGARFHSGRPMCDAAAVLEALRAVPLRSRRRPAGQIWYWDPVESVRALDSSTIELRLLFPYRRIPTLLWGTHAASTTTGGASRSARSSAGRRRTGPERIAWSPSRHRRSSPSVCRRRPAGLSAHRVVRFERGG